MGDRYSYIIFSSFSQYLENYLWVNYTPEVSSNAYLMSICCIVNEKFRENVPAWEVKNASKNTLFLWVTLCSPSLQLTLNWLLSTTSFYLLNCVSGVQEGAQPFPILLQMCDGSCIGRRGGWPHSEGTNCAAGLPGSLFQQSGVYKYADIQCLDSVEQYVTLNVRLLLVRPMRMFVFMSVFRLLGVIG